MNNATVREKTTIKTLQELSNTLMRDLTQEELNIILDKGVDYFINEELGMNKAEFDALKKIKDIISAYCTKSQADFDNELEGDITIPYYALKSIVNAMEDKMKGTVEEKEKKSEVWGENPASECIKTEDSSNKTKAQELCDLLNKIPESIHNWVECYVKYVTDHKTVLDVLKSDHSGYTEDERIGDIVDAIKDAVIDACISKLKAEGEIELDPEIMSEVTAKIWHSEDNVRINITNNKLKVEFK